MCCDSMRQHVNGRCILHNNDPWECPDIALATYLDGRIGIPVRDGGRSMVVLDFCPWCRAALPGSEQTAPTFAEFSAANRERCESFEGFGHQVDSWSLSDWFTAVMGELGEAANIAKKLNRVRDGIRGNSTTALVLRKNLRNEIADTFIYLDLLAQSAGFDLGRAVIETFEAKSAEIEYPAHFKLPDDEDP